jgi:hypothetical protein
MRCGDFLTAAVFAEAKFRSETGTREEPAMINSSLQWWSSTPEECGIIFDS